MFNKIVQRFTSMARKDMTVFQGIRDDPEANTEAAIIVAVSAFLAALGAAVWSGSFVGTFLVRLIAGVLLNWLLWSYVTMLVATRLYGAETDFWPIARVLGYANAPMALAILGLIPCLGAFIASIAWILALLLAFFAVRESLRLTTEQTIITLAIGWVIVLLVSLVLSFVF